MSTTRMSGSKASLFSSKGPCSLFLICLICWPKFSLFYFFPCSSLPYLSLKSVARSMKVSLDFCFKLFCDILFSYFVPKLTLSLNGNAFHPETGSGATTCLIVKSQYHNCRTLDNIDKIVMLLLSVHQLRYYHQLSP